MSVITNLGFEFLFLISMEMDTGSTEKGIIIQMEKHKLYQQN